MKKSILLVFAFMLYFTAASPNKTYGRHKFDGVNRNTRFNIPIPLSHITIRLVLVNVCCQFHIIFLNQIVSQLELYFGLLVEYPHNVYKLDFSTTKTDEKWEDKSKHHRKNATTTTTARPHYELQKKKYQMLR